MSYMLIVAETSISAGTSETTRLKSIVEKCATLVRSSEAGEVIAENCYLFDMQTGASMFAHVLLVLEDAELKYKTSSFQDHPMFANQ